MIGGLAGLALYFLLWPPDDLVLIVFLPVAVGL